jgi:hypothetical protein
VYTEIESYHLFGKSKITESSMQVYLRYPEGIDGRIKNGKYKNIKRDRSQEHLKYEVSKESHNAKIRRYRQKKRELGYAFSLTKVKI